MRKPLYSNSYRIPVGNGAQLQRIRFACSFKLVTGLIKERRFTVFSVQVREKTRGRAAVPD